MKLLGRRNFLEAMGLGAGAHLLGSIFNTMLPEALGATSPGRKRLIMFTNGNGFLVKYYSCVARSETDWDLSSPAYAPVAAYKKDMVVLQKFYNPIDVQLHGNSYASLCVMPAPPTAGIRRSYLWPPGGISIDRLIAKNIGAKDPFPSTALGAEEVPGRILCSSADGKGQPFPAIGSPVQAYATYFGGAQEAATPGAAERALVEQKSLLDGIRGDIARMNARLAGPEKAKLDQYLEGLRGLEQQLTELVGVRGTCDPAAYKPGSTLTRPSHSAQTYSAHVAITFAAQLCGLTRVSHISILGKEAPFNSYGFTGAHSHHGSHHDYFWDSIERIDAYCFSKVAQMLDLLSSVREGNGTMLDNSLVMYFNTCGGAHHRGSETYSAILFGKAGGALRTNRYLSYPYRAHCISDFFVSLANLMGVDIKTFGDPQHCQGPLPGVV